MNPEHAKSILALYRPNSADAQDPDFAEAIEAARRDPALGRWFEQQCAAHQTLRAKFQQLEPPPDLRDRILSQTQSPTTRLVSQHRPTLALAAAAALILLAVLTFNKPPESGPGEFANFESRMVRSALREYRMDILTNREDRVRSYLGSRGAPAAFPLPPEVANRQLTGGGVLSWRSHPVSMMCYDRGDGQMQFLFVIERNAVADPPPPKPQARASTVSRLATLSWSDAEQAYVLASPGQSPGTNNPPAP